MGDFFACGVFFQEYFKVYGVAVLDFEFSYLFYRACVKT